MTYICRSFITVNCMYNMQHVNYKVQFVWYFYALVFVTTEFLKSLPVPEQCLHENIIPKLILDEIYFNSLQFFMFSSNEARHFANNKDHFKFPIFLFQKRRWHRFFLSKHVNSWQMSQDSTKDMQLVAP